MALPVSETDWFTAIGWPLLALLLALLLVRGVIAYARHRGMLDQPGRRRSHTLPTPRGGGLGVVVAVLICLSGAWLTLPARWPPAVLISVLGALALVALTGWWDDHRPLPVWPRLGAQLLAVLGFSLALIATGLPWWWLPLLLGAGAWSINLHNFMDGIDGLLAQQAIFVTCALSLLAAAAAQPALAIAAAVVAAATLGFWCYNRPPARIFMGDVGSGSLGLLIFAFSVMLWRRQSASLWPALILCSAFVTDASLTLLTRIWRGRRWHAAHREHLYQWLVRRGGTHGGVDATYMGWNLLVAAPGAWLACSHPRTALPVSILVYLSAAAVWLALKRRCLRRNLSKDRHVVA